MTGPRRPSPASAKPRPSSPTPGAVPMTAPTQALSREQLINELQSFGVRLADPGVGVQSRRGGAGPSDHKAVTIDGHTVMAPVHTVGSFDSPYLAEAPTEDGESTVIRDGKIVGRMSFPPQPRFYGLQTLDGVPYSKIA